MRNKLYGLTLLLTILITMISAGVLMQRTPVSSGSVLKHEKPLLEVAEVGKNVIVDGVTIPSLLVNGESYVRLDQLQEQLPWLNMTAEETQCSFSLRDTDIPVVFPRGTVKDFEKGTLPEHACIISDEVCYLPAESFAAESGMRSISDEDAFYFSGVVMNGTTLPGGLAIPVLMYHAFSEEIWGEPELFVSADVFRQQMQYLLDAGYQPIWFEDLYHISDYTKPILITVDDGYNDNYTDLFPVLKELNVKITLNLIAGVVDDASYSMFLNSQQVREMSDSGLVSFQSHTVSHGKLDEASEDTTRYEMSESQRMIAHMTGKIPYLLSCPESRSSDITYAVVPDYYSFMTVAGVGLTWSTDSGAYQINRTSIHRSITLDEFMSMYP